MRYIYLRFIVMAVILFFFNTLHSYAQRHVILDSIVRVLENNSIYRTSVNWKHVRSTIYKSVDSKATDSIHQIIPAVQKLFSLLGDRHGVLIYKNDIFKGRKKHVNRKVDSSLYTYAYDEQYAFCTKILDGKYGYISVPSPNISLGLIKDRKLALEMLSSMSQTLQDSLCSLSTQNLNGIIVDLRLSLGGSYAIPISGLSPLIGDGTVFTVQQANSNIEVKLLNGSMLENADIISNTKADCSFKDSKIAVLLGPLTGSAGEQTALAFKGKSNVKFIGENTAGYLTMTKLVQFSDDLIFTYSGGYIKARDNNVYAKDILPDLLINAGDNFKSLSDDAKVKAAIDWFKD